MSSLWRWLKSRVGPRPRPSERYEVTDEALLHLSGDRQVGRLAWKDLAEVQIWTTPHGPWSDDLFFLLSGAGTTLAVPVSQAGGVVSRLTPLPGFDAATLIRAMASTSLAEFLCWRRQGS